MRDLYVLNKTTGGWMRLYSNITYWDIEPGNWLTVGVAGGDRHSVKIHGDWVEIRGSETSPTIGVGELRDLARGLAVAPKSNGVASESVASTVAAGPTNGAIVKDETRTCEWCGITSKYVTHQHPVLT